LVLTVTVGLAQLQFGESNDDVIARADADLCRQRGQRSTDGHQPAAFISNPIAAFR